MRWGTERQNTEIIKYTSDNDDGHNDTAATCTVNAVRLCVLYDPVFARSAMETMRSTLTFPEDFIIIIIIIFLPYTRLAWSRN